MSLFSKPKCPYCGGKLTPTGYAFPFPQYRCKSCIKRNEMQEEIEDLKNQVRQLKNKKQ